MAPPAPYPLENAFEKAWPAHEWRDLHVVLSVSGGADSVAMLRAAVAVKESCGGSGRLFVAHLDHSLRGDASTGDADWLKTLCERLEVPIHAGRADVAAIADSQGDGLEAAARTARYDFLRQTAERLGARFVAVAHTLDDHVETILHHILRGTGLDGLRGIPLVRALSPSVALIRPLLVVRRRDVLDYLAAIGQDHRTDATNADVRWTRNHLRHELLPAIRKHYHGDVDAALIRLSAQAAETQDLISAIVAPLADDCVTMDFAPAQAAAPTQTCRIRIDGGKLADQPALIIRAVCTKAWQVARWPQQSMGYDQWEQLAAIVMGESHMPTVNLPGNVRVEREGFEIVLERYGLP